MYKKSDDDVVILAAGRTPIGSFGGELSSVASPELGGVAIRGVLDRVLPGRGAVVDQVLMGCVFQAGLGQSPARQAALCAGLEAAVSCTTVNKVCASGMKAVTMAAQALLTGDAEVAVAGGMENMSSVPFYVRGMRSGQRIGNAEMTDGLLCDGLTDVFSGRHMGVCGELCAEQYGIGREEQDDFARQSYLRSALGWENGFFSREVIPVEVPGRKGQIKTVDRDEEYRKVDFDKIPRLKSCFKKDGTITAANASTINDGAAALVLTTRRKALQLGVSPIASILSYADAGQEPERFTTTPSIAVGRALDRAGLSVRDIDYWELNEAFSVVGIVNSRLLGLDMDRVNVYGGAVSLGHPLGASGARILVTLLGVLEEKKAEVGSAAICNGGGGASAVVVRREA